MQRDDVIHWLDERGYVMYWHTVPLYNPANLKGNPTNLFEGIVSLNLLAVPASVPQEIVGLEKVAIARRRPGSRHRRAQPPGSASGRSAHGRWCRGGAAAGDAGAAAGDAGAGRRAPPGRAGG